MPIKVIASSRRKNVFSKDESVLKQASSPTIFFLTENTAFREIGADNTEPVLCKTEISLMALNGEGCFEGVELQQKIKCLSPLSIEMKL